MSEIKVIKIKSSHPSQGDYVLINESDFDPTIHELFEPAAEVDNSRLNVAQLKDALVAAGIEFDDTAKKADLLALLEAGKQE